MNILVISDLFYPSYGGTVTYTDSLCSSLTLANHNVVLLTHVTANNYNDKIHKYTVLRVGKTRKNYIINVFYGVLAIRHFIKKIIFQYNINIVHVSAGPYLILGLSLMKKLSAPVVWTIHNMAPAETIPLYITKNLSINKAINKIYYSTVKYMHKQIVKHGLYTHAISVSDATYDKIIKSGGDKDKITIIPNGIIVPKIIHNKKIEHNTINEFTLLVVGNIALRKGQYQLLLALRYLIDKIPGLHCIFVGQISEIEYYQKIQKYIKSCKLSDKVTIINSVSRDKLETYYDLADVYIQPSFDEGFSIAVMEAMLHDLPVIGTNTGAIPILLDSGRGMCIQSPKPKLLADAIYRYYIDPSLRKNVATLGKKYILQNYDWKSICSKIIKLYSQILSDKK